MHLFEKIFIWSLWWNKCEGWKFIFLNFDFKIFYMENLYKTLTGSNIKYQLTSNSRNWKMRNIGNKWVLEALFTLKRSHNMTKTWWRSECACQDKLLSLWQSLDGCRMRILRTSFVNCKSNQFSWSYQICLNT